MVSPPDDRKYCWRPPEWRRSLNLVSLSRECAPSPQGRPNRPPPRFRPEWPTKEAHRRAFYRLDGLLRSEAGRASPRPSSRIRDDQRGKQGEQLDDRSHALTCSFRARGRIRTDDLPITTRMLGVDLDGSRRIWPAHVGCLVGPDGSRRIQKDRLDDHRDDPGTSDTKSDGKASNPMLAWMRRRAARWPGTLASFLASP
jgi:hypothetical protein